MIPVPVTAESLIRFNRGAYDEMCGRLRGAGKDPVNATWEYDWSIGSPRFNPRDAIQDQARGRVYVPRNHESDIRVVLNVKIDGRVYARRNLPMVPEEVRVQARTHLR